MSAVGEVEWGQKAGIGSGGTCEFPPLPRPGVYVLAKVSAAGDRAKYAGRTGNLQGRIAGHIKGGENDCLKAVLGGYGDAKVRATIQAGESVRKNTGHARYRHYRGLGHALCNDALPEGRRLGEIQWPF